MRRLGLVLHPSRGLEQVLEGVSAWAAGHGVEVGQVQIDGQSRRVADPVDPAACDLIVALGGDGTTLAALHAAAPHGRAVLGVACGSVGVLTSTAGDRVTGALDEVAGGAWAPADVPALEVGFDGGRARAINDVAIVRDGPGQVIVSVDVDDVTYVRVSGDGLVVATALGSSAYTMAAGGPLLAPGATAMAVTPLAPHGGSCPPLVAGAESRLTLQVDASHAGVRFEVDGRLAAIEASALTVELREGYSTLVRLADEEPRLAGLRRRGLLSDSPRVLVRDARPAP